MTADKDDAAIDELRRKRIAAAGKRARMEAEARRQKETFKQTSTPEKGGRKGLDPARYGDWEKDGIVSDF